MDENQQNVNQTGTPVPQPEPGPQNKRRLVLVLVAALVLIGVIGAIMSLTGSKKTTTGNQSAAAGKIFDEMLAAAAVKTEVRLTYVQQDFASKADFEAKKVNQSLYSVAQLDTNTKEYRAVYAKQQGPAGNLYYVVRRCLQNGVMFKPTKSDIDTKTLADAQALLAQAFTATVAADRTEARDCSPTNPNHVGRATDGIIPAGLSKTQISVWLQRLKDSRFVTVQDQGMTTYNKQSVRKLHITTASIAGTANFFTDAQKGAGLQLTDDKGAPGTESYRLDEMATSDNIDGFYLINEQTKLPVYSEFTAAALLVDKGQPKAGKVLKQAYIYPQGATLGEKSTIETLE